VSASGLSNNKWQSCIFGIITASLGRSEAEADWPDPKVGGRPALVLLLSNEPGEL